VNPGRELDQLIAEKVMGLRVFSQGKSHDGPVYSPDRMFGEEPIPQYSTDIKAAWEVVEEVTKKLNWNCGDREKYLPVIHRSRITIESNWRCGWTDSYLDCSEFEAESESVPHAICLAALKAVGDEL
jgi:hypothetical protein